MLIFAYIIMAISFGCWIRSMYLCLQKYHEKAFEFSKTLDDAKWWFDKYHEWEKAFEMAKDGGAVEFG